MGGGQEYKVIFGSQCRSDLKEIVSVVRRASGSPEIAERLGTKLLQRALTLSTFPERGRIVPELGVPGVREIIVKSYRLVYRISGNTVQVLRFWHGARGALEIDIDDFSV